MGIHEPVDRYDAGMGKRVDRVFAMLQPIFEMNTLVR